MVALAAVDDDPQQHPLGEHLALGVAEAIEHGAQRARAPGVPPSSLMSRPSPEVISSSGPIGVAPCETQAAARRRRSARRPRRRARRARRETAPPGRAACGARDAAEHRHAGRAVGELGEHGVGGEGVRIGQQDRAARALQVGHAGDRHAVLDLGDLGVERRDEAVLERRRPHGDRRPALDLATVADDAARAAADQHVRRKRLVDALERRLGIGEMRAGGEHDGEVDRAALQLGGDLGRRLDRAGPRIGCGGQATRDAHAHRLRTILAGRTRPYWVRGARMLALFGPTGVGKTDVAIALAERIRARGGRPVAVSADALQVYRGLEILTGVPDARQQARLEHRLISFLPVDARFSVAEYAALAHAEIDGLLAEGATPIVVGGTGLYLRAALARARAAPAAAAGRAGAAAGRRSRRAARRRCTRELALAAPNAAARINPADSHRIIRALELHEQGALDDAPTARPTACGPPTRATRPASSASSATATSSTRASTAASTRWWPRRRRGGAARGRGRRVSHRARRARLRASCCAATSTR